MRYFFTLTLLVLNLVASERIIALSPSINEIIFALGSGDEVVGNTEYCTYPEASQKVQKVGGYFSPSLERILALQPTLVIMQKNNYKLSRKLNLLGIRTKIVKIDTLKNIHASINTIGSLLHKEKEAKKIIADIDSALTDLKGITTNRKVLFVIGHNTSLDARVFVAGQNLYFDDIIQASGNLNALQSSRKGQPILNAENIIATNPDIVVLLAHSMKEKGLTPSDLIDPWRKLPINAAKTNSIYIENKKYAGIPSDRLVDFIHDFQAILESYTECNGKKIVSQSPYISHELAFFDMQKCIVGASIYDDIVGDNIPRTGKVIVPDKEAIATIAPDFLFTSDWTKPQTLKTITPKKTQSFILHGFDSMKEIEENLFTIGTALKIPNTQKRVKEFHKAYTKLAKSIDPKGKKVLLLSACSKETYSYTTHTYLGDLFSQIGFDVVDHFKNVHKFAITNEKNELNQFIKLHKPDFIFGFVPYSKATTCKVLETDKKLPIIYLNADNFMHPSPTLLEGLQELKSKEDEW